MTHFINKTVTVTLPATFTGSENFKIIHSRHMLMDTNADAWIRIDNLDSHDVYARLELAYELH